MVSKITEKEIRQFLRKRRLTPTFNRFRKLKGKRKRPLKVSIDGIPQRLVIFKRGNRTIIADAFTLKVLATTKKFKVNEVEKGFISRLTVKNNRVSKVRDINLSVVETQARTNVIQVERTKPLRNKLGKLFINVTFVLGKLRHTSEGGSRKVRNLSLSSERDKAFDEAFKGALSTVTFSYESFVVNWIHYSYFNKRGVTGASI